MTTFEQTYGTREQRLAEVERMRQQWKADEAAGKLIPLSVSRPNNTRKADWEAYRNEIERVFGPSTPYQEA